MIYFCNDQICKNTNYCDVLRNSSMSKKNWRHSCTKQKSVPLKMPILYEMKRCNMWHQFFFSWKTITAMRTLVQFLLFMSRCNMAFHIVRIWESGITNWALMSFNALMNYFIMAFQFWTFCKTGPTQVTHEWLFLLMYHRNMHF